MERRKEKKIERIRLAMSADASMFTEAENTRVQKAPLALQEDYSVVR